MTSETVRSVTYSILAVVILALFAMALYAS